MSTNLGCGEFEKDIVSLFDINSGKFKGGKTCLQIGCRSRKGFMNFCAPFTKLGYTTHDLLEAHAPNVDALRPKLAEANTVICGDVRKINEYDALLPSYDVIVHWHGPEHITKKQFEDVLPKIKARCSKAFIIGCPHGKYDQGKIHSNKFEEHVAHWLPEEFEKFGFETWTFGSGQPHKKEMMMGVLWI